MSAETPPNPAFFAMAIVAAFVVIFPLFWMFVVWMISLFSGWRALAQRYPATVPPQGKTYGGQTAIVGFSRYRNVMTMITNSVGIYIKPMWIFGVGHPPLFIPWSEFSNPSPTVHRWVPLVRLDVGHPKQTTIALPPYILESEAAAKPLASVSPR
jgi:hypothetical protein